MAGRCWAALPIRLRASFLPVMKTPSRQKPIGCWLRLAAVADDMQPAPVLHALWAALQPELNELGIRQIAVLILRDWIVRHLPEIGFTYAEDIVTLRRAAQTSRMPMIASGSW